MHPRSILACIMMLPGLAQADPPKATPPAPHGPIPNARQLNWQGLHAYAFIHFGPNTFTGQQWGGGDEAPEVFNPTDFNADQIARTVKDAGLTGLIVTAKHHDGFCLWPSAYTDHSVKNSPWRGGHGDVVKELSDACHREGILFGVYLSPWDRHRADYGKPGYIAYYRNQIRELLTGYGPIFEMWFDGANGGTGYYGGAKESRKIDARTYYEWDKTFEMLHQLQPNTVTWSSDGGCGDVEWGGSERGIVPDPCWATDGRSQYDGKKWQPKEADVSIRRDWFYNPDPAQEVTLKSPAQLVDIYLKSVGRGANLILNLPPDRRGQIPDADVKTLHEWHDLMAKTFGADLALGSTITASNTRGNDDRFSPGNMLKTVSSARDSYWATDDQVLTPNFVVDLGSPKTFNLIELKEYLPLGQRVGKVAFDAWQGGAWVPLLEVKNIGSQRIASVRDTTTDKLRVRVLEAAACPAISHFSLFMMPSLLVEPVISRDKEGVVTLSPETVANAGNFHYSLDGQEPSVSSPVYKAPFSLPNGGIVKARTILPSGPQSAVTAVSFGMCKGQWTIAETSFQPYCHDAIDDNVRTSWLTREKNGDHTVNHPAPHYLVVDLHDTKTLSGFTYLPHTANPGGAVDQYEFYLSMDGKSWGESVAKGEFANMKASPDEQKVPFAERQARYFKFIALHTVDPKDGVSVAELGLIGK